MTVTSARTLVLALNPAIQKTLELSSALVHGEVHRASAVDVRVGGKGQGAAAAIRRVDVAARAAVVQFVGEQGHEGAFVVDGMEKDGVECINGWFPGATRTCTTVVSSEGGGRVSTELVEPTATIPAPVCDKLLADALAAVPSSGAVIIAGSAPPGAEAFYARFSQGLRQAAPGPAAEWPLVVVDCPKGVDELLACGRADVMKIAVHELQSITGKSALEDGARALLFADPGSGRERAAIGGEREAAMGEARTPGASLGVLAVTAGAGAAHLFVRTSDAEALHWELAVPRVDCVNAIGAGDVCTGVFASKLQAAAYAPGSGERGRPDAVCDAFAWGLAAASARCTRLRPDQMELADVFRLRTRVGARAVAGLRRDAAPDAGQVAEAGSPAADAAGEEEAAGEGVAAAGADDGAPASAEAAKDAGEAGSG